MWLDLSTPEINRNRGALMGLFQFHLERDGSTPLAVGDVKNALDEMLFSGGSLNLKLLGAEQWSDRD